ncbi:MAG: radical SAM protein [Thermaceae bacterium]
MRVELRPEATVVALEDAVLSFDREGRLYHFFRKGCTFRRALDGSLHLRYREGKRRRRKLTPEEALEVYAQAYGLVATVDLKERAEEILRYSPLHGGRLEALLDDGPYRRAYPWPVSILPPDQYLSVVLQATFGCTWNRCLFCAFYRDRPFQVQKPEAFSEHIARVKDLLGRGLLLRRGVFLGDGNALALGEALVPLLEAAWAAFRMEVAGFLDLYTGVKKAPSFWKRLRGLGLRRVYVGLETGSETLLRLLNKPGHPKEAIGLIRALKEAGLSVGVILLVGAGGEAFREEHFAQSLGLLSQLPLDREDLVYLSPFVEDLKTPYAQLGLKGVDPEEELPRFFQAVRRLGLKASRYDIREFVY